MGIKVHVHQSHVQYTNGERIIEVEGHTVGACLKNIAVKYPEFGKQIFEKQGKLNHLFEIYVNGESAYPKELEKEVKDGDDVYITRLLSGG